MPIEVQCPSCGKQLKAPDAQAGRSGRCPRCKSEIVIPLLPMSGGGAPGPVATMTPHLLDAGFPELPPRVDVGRPPPIPVRSPLGDPFDSAAAESDTGQYDDAQIDPKNWFGLRLSLKTTEIALLVESISCVLISLSVIAMALLSRSARGEITTLQALSVLMVWGIVGVVFGWGALVTGWLVCLAAWPKRDRRLVLAAVWCAGVSVGAMLIFTSLGMLGVFGRAAQVGPPGPASPKMIVVIGSVASAASLILFNFFLTSIRRRLGQYGIELQPIVYGAVIGVLTLWCLICNLALQPTSQLMVWVVLLSNVATFVLEFVWLWLINAFVSRDLRVSQAWNRL